MMCGTGKPAFAVAFVVCVVFAGGCAGTQPGGGAARGYRPHDRLIASEHLVPALRELSVLSTGQVPAADHLRQLVARMRAGQLDLNTYIRELVDEPGFSETVAPRLILGEDNVEPYAYSFFVLKSFEAPSSAEPIYYREEPCAPAVAEAVKPWWDLDSEVKVCPDSHRPATLVDAESGLRCLRATRQQGSCGCGPNLAFCARDETQVRQILTSLHRESTATIARVVGDDAPLSGIFTDNATVRDRYAEHAYVRAQISAGELSQVPSYRGWPEEGRLASRPESRTGQHAGLLTAPQLVYMTDSTRDRMRILYRIAWCSNPTALGGDTGAILELAEADLRSRAHTSSAWEQLASQPGCTDCHARLDYGMQFFHEYPGIADAYGPIASLRREGSGPLFGRDISDRRGEAELSPAGFAELLVAQPEYTQCITRSVAEYVLGRAVRPTHIDALAQSFSRSGRLKPTMRVALRHWVDMRVERLFSDVRVRELGSIRGPHPEQPADFGRAGSEVAGTDSVMVTDQLRESLRQHCIGCHSQSSSERVNLDQAELRRETLWDAVTRVAFYAMPPGSRGMDPADRRVLVDRLVDAGSPPHERALARQYYGGGHLPFAVGHLRNVVREIETVVGASTDTQEGYLVQDTLAARYSVLTPSYVMQIAEAADRVCEQRFANNEARKQSCLIRSMAPDLAARGL